MLDALLKNRHNWARRNGVEMSLDQDTLFDELNKEDEIRFKLLW